MRLPGNPWLIAGGAVLGVVLLEKAAVAVQRFTTGGTHPARWFELASPRLPAGVATFGELAQRHTQAVASAARWRDLADVWTTWSSIFDTATRFALDVEAYGAAKAQTAQGPAFAAAVAALNDFMVRVGGYRNWLTAGSALGTLGTESAASLQARLVDLGAKLDAVSTTELQWVQRGVAEDVGEGVGEVVAPFLRGALSAAHGVGSMAGSLANGLAGGLAGGLGFDTILVLGGGLVVAWAVLR
jgi:hypothetical protein